jgi:hypothetical protein
MCSVKKFLFVLDQRVQLNPSMLSQRMDLNPDISEI